MCLHLWEVCFRAYSYICMYAYIQVPYTHTHTHTYTYMHTKGGAREYYSASDLRVGGVVSVFGRQLVLDDCDSATRAYYEENFGELFAKSVGADSANKRPKSALIIPPHNGFGHEEDSRQNCMSLHPKPPKVCSCVFRVCVCVCRCICVCAYNPAS